MIPMLVSILLCAFLFVVLTIVLAILEKDTPNSWFIKSFLLGGILGVCLYFFIKGNTNNTEDKYYQETTKLYSIERQANIQGSFFLGSSSFYSEQFYIFYIKKQNGAKVLDKISSYKTEIFEGDYEPKLVKTICFRGKTFNYLAGIPLPKDNSCKNGRVIYSLYLPKNTIIKKMEL